MNPRDNVQQHDVHGFSRVECGAVAPEPQRDQIFLDRQMDTGAPFLESSAHSVIVSKASPFFQNRFTDLVIDNLVRQHEMTPAPYFRLRIAVPETDFGFVDIWFLTSLSDYSECVSVNITSLRPCCADFRN